MSNKRSEIYILDTNVVFDIIVSSRQRHHQAESFFHRFKYFELGIIFPVERELNTIVSYVNSAVVMVLRNALKEHESDWNSLDLDKRLKAIESSYNKESQNMQRYGDIISYILAHLSGEYVKNFKELYDFITSINLSYTINEKLNSRVQSMFTTYDFPTESRPLATEFISNIENFMINMG